MKINDRMWGFSFSWLPILLALAYAPLMTPAHAGHEINEYDFSLRFPAAISRFASYADVAALGTAQAASVWSTSVNPASAAWRPSKDNPIIGITPQFTGIKFSEGNELAVTSEALTINAGDNWGVFLPAITQISGNHSFEANGLGFEFDANYFQFQWGRHLGPDWAIGFNFNATVSDTRIDTGGVQLVRTQSESYDFRLGALRKLTENVRLGLVVDYAFAPARTDNLVVDPLTFMPGSVRTYDMTQQVVTRIGIAWDYVPGWGTFYLDYQAGTFWNDTGTLVVHRFPVGIEQALIKDILFIRAGAIFDTRGEVTTTAGLGVSIGTKASLDLGYQLNSFPEIRQEFGQAQSFVVSVSVGF
jgi:hypothetical protein